MDAVQMLMFVNVDVNVDVAVDQTTGMHDAFIEYSKMAKSKRSTIVCSGL